MRRKRNASFPRSTRPVIAEVSQTRSAPNGLWILVATILASSMAFIDGTVVNVALPALQANLHATTIGIQWVVEAYALVLASLLLLGGSLGDLYGRRKVFLLGVALFALASAGCGMAPTIALLIVARGIQGAGAALLVPGSLALITASFADEERGRAIGTWSGFTAITTALGPVLGGWLVAHLSWRWVFFINLPLALAAIAIAVWRVPENRDGEASPQVDWTGAALATAGLGAVTFALINASRGHAIAAGLGCGGVALLIAFLFVESHSPAPMVSLHLFRSRTFSATNALTFLLYAPLSGILFFFPLDLIQVQGYSPTQAGGALLPLILLIFLLSRWSGGLVARYGARLPLVVGPLVAALGFALFTRPGVGAVYWTGFFPAVAVLGIGMAISVAPLTTAVMESVPTDDAGVASGVNNAVSRLAGLLAIAVFGLILSAGFNRALDQRLPSLHLDAAALAHTNQQRSLLAGASSGDPQTKLAIDESFIAGYRKVIWLSVVLAALAGGTAFFIDARPIDGRAQPGG